MKVLVILGPTATGKTDIALHLARKLNGELVACDSRQVYVGLDIGTGKMPGRQNPKYAIRNTNNNSNFEICASDLSKHNGYWMMDGIKIWMYDVTDPKKQYDVAQYIRGTTKVINDISNKGKLPIIVGGSGLYLKGILQGFSTLGFPINKQLRKSLEGFSLKVLQSKLKKLSREKWQGLNNSDKNNPRRLIRAIELENLPRRSPYGHLRGVTPANVLKIGLKASREMLNQRIDARVLSRMDQGMVEETEQLHKDGLSISRMRELGLEYGVLADYLEGNIDKEQLVKMMQIKIHRYAKRQMTWFNKEKDVRWFDISRAGWQEKVAKLALYWYNNGVTSNK
ncbi:tRNA dimethylallyltransferase [Candidatus Daviesbacteria bacterium]|nr:tRNA dimethylallyltransferase [Candidatus Daviesbacteria bacterium]